MTVPMLDLRCPQCGQIDLVRKVTAIIAGDTGYSTYVGRSSGSGLAVAGGDIVPVLTSGSTKMSGSSTSAIGQRLSSLQPPLTAPVPPKNPPLWQGSWKVLILEDLVPAAGFFLAFVGAFKFAQANWPWWLAPHVGTGSRLGIDGVAKLLAISLVAGAIFVGPCLVWFRLPFMRRLRVAAKKSSAQHEQEMIEFTAQYDKDVQSQREAWEEQWRAWDRSYYCGRCDFVFEVAPVN